MSDARDALGGAWIVGILGAPGAGKDTVADMLQQCMTPAFKLSFSTVLYEEVSKAYNVTIEWLQDRTNKDQPQIALAPVYCVDPEMRAALSAKFMHRQPVSPREVLQTWGNHVRSKNPDYVINSVRNDLYAALGAGISVIVPDVRTFSEFALIEEAGQTIRVINPRIEQHLKNIRGMEHALENDLRTAQVNYTIVNKGSLDELRDKVAALPMVNPVESRKI